MFECKSMRKLSTRVFTCLMGVVLLMGIAVSGALVAYANDTQPGVDLQSAQMESSSPDSIDQGMQPQTDSVAYAVLKSGTLTFYYDGNKDSRDGTKYEVPEASASKNDVPWDEKRASITSVVFDSSFANTTPLSTAYWFYNCENLAAITGLNYLNTSQATSMKGMLMFCGALTGPLDLSVLDTSNVADMDSMLYGCIGLTGVTFGGRFDTSNVTSMAQMFGYCRGLTSLDLSTFKTPKLEDMRGMFNTCVSLKTLNFGNAFNTSNVKNMYSVFMDCAELTSVDLKSFNTSKVTTMQDMFRGCKKLGAITYSSGFDTSNVTSMGGMYQDCQLLTTIPLSSFNTQNVLDMQNMFNGCSGLTSLTFGKNFTAEKTDLMNGMFSNCSSLTTLDLSSFKPLKSTTMYGMFSDCSSLRSLTLGEDFNTSFVRGFGRMFANCSSITDLDLSMLDTTKATDMHDMFAGCTGLKSVALGLKFNFKGDNIKESYYEHDGRIIWVTGWALLPTPYSESPYTGKWWKEVGGTEYTPVEMQSLTDAAVAGTWTWAQETKTVTFDSNGGSAVASDKVVSGGTVAKPADPTRSGYTFKEWQLGGSSYDFATPVTSDITLKAAWDAAPAPVAKRTVSFDANGGSGTMAAVQIDDGSQYVLPACTFTAPSGKAFDKWDKGAPGAKITVTADTTLTAQWKDAPEPGPGPEPQPVATKPMHRLYNPNSGEHFYTADDNEQEYLAGIGWQYEGVGWTAPAESDRPVYRLYNRNAGDHHYTLDAGERDYLIGVGWEDEGIGWYSADETGTPLYRQYNPNAKGAGSHNYTADTNERDWLVNNGWNDEGIGWYGV